MYKRLLFAFLSSPSLFAHKTNKAPAHTINTNNKPTNIVCNLFQIAPQEPQEEGKNNATILSYKL